MNQNEEVTVTSTITTIEIDRAEKEYEILKEEDAEIERQLGTYETYGSFSTGKPKLSKEAA